MNVKALMHEPCSRGMELAHSRRDGEHFEIAGKDHIRAGESLRETTRCHQGSGDCDEPPRQPAVLGPPEIDRSDAFDIADRARLAPKADRSDRGSAGNQHSHTPVHGGIGKVVHEIGNFFGVRRFAP